MLAENIISDGILPLKTSDTGKTALSWMEDYRVSHLPIVNNEEFLGLISEWDIYNQNSLDEPLGNHKLSLSNPYVNGKQPITDVLKLVHKDNLTLVPVLDDDMRYMGVVTLQNLVSAMASALSVNEPGGMLVLGLSYNDYSLTEIGNIVESNDAKILSTFIFTRPESVKMNLFIKINRTDLNAIIKTFLRYNYEIVAVYTEEENRDDLKDRYDAFIRYLNI